MQKDSTQGMPSLACDESAAMKQVGVDHTLAADSENKHSVTET